MQDLLQIEATIGYQALAIDEHRRAFPPSVWHRPIIREDDSLSSDNQTLEQAWFAGAHSNVGGGYVDSALADMAFLWMASKATAARRTDDDQPLALRADPGSS